MEKPLFGRVLGSNRGVEGFSNHKASWRASAGGGANYVDGHYTGYKYQCVEYARRWLLQVKKLTFASLPCACNIWELNSVENVVTGEQVPLARIPNGSPVPPQESALLIYKRRFGMLAGHVAIITEVDVNRGVVRIAEQNEDDWPWPGDYSRELKLEYENNGFWIRDNYSLFGWMVYENIPHIPQVNNSRCSIF